jgi:RNA polymerase-associated protein RTF1
LFFSLIKLISYQNHISHTNTSLYSTPFRSKPKKKKATGSKPVTAAANDGDNDDLVEDEEDAARLAKMSEFDREMLLAERAEQRQQKVQRDQILAAEAAAENAKAKGAQRRSGREVREETAKKSAMEELKAARQRKAQGKKAHDAEDIDAAAADSDQGGEDGPQRHQGAYYSDDSEEDGEDRGPGGTRWAARDRTEEDEEADEEADFEELKSIQVRRHKLEEWINKPHFESTLPGCMVRVVAGEKKTPDNVPVMLNARPEQRYMVVQVVGVEQVVPGFHKFLEGGQGWKSPYPFGPDGIKTSKWLRVLRGTSERLWPLAQVSNSGFTEEEFASWHRACESVAAAAGGGQKRQITRGEVAEVHKRLIDADSYVYTAEDVARMLEEKRLKGQGTRNVAIEMARLERERDAAVERNDEERVLEVQQEIAALEATAAAANAAKQGAAASMAQLNKKNAEKNFKSAFKSGKDGAGGGGAAAGTLDPFSRRATRTKNYWNTKGQRGEAEGDGNGNGAAVLTEAELADLAAAEAAAAAAAAAKAEAAEITLVDLSGLDLSLLDLPPKVAPIARKLLGSHGRNSVAAVRSGSRGGGDATLSLADYKRRYNTA